MKRPLRYIRQHLSLRLGLIITLIIAVAFTLLSDILRITSAAYYSTAAIANRRSITTHYRVGPCLTIATAHLTSAAGTDSPVVEATIMGHCRLTI